VDYESESLQNLALVTAKLFVQLLWDSLSGGENGGGNVRMSCSVVEVVISHKLTLPFLFFVSPKQHHMQSERRVFQKA